MGLIFQLPKYFFSSRIVLNPKYLCLSQATDFVSEDGSFGDAELKLAKALRVSCWLNGAACCLKLNDFPGAIKLCSQVTINQVMRKLQSSQLSSNWSNQMWVGELRINCML